jgi:DNA-binding CsgD family transcriptional regulator
MNFTPENIQIPTSCIESQIALNDGDRKLVDLLQGIGRLLKADSAEVTWRPRRDCQPTIFASWRESMFHPAIYGADDRGHHVSSHILDYASKRDWTLIIRRYSENLAFSPAETTVAELAADIFRSAFKIWRQADVRARRLAAFESLLGNLDCGILLLNSHSHVVFSNEKAGELVKSGSGLTITAGRLAAKGFANTVRLQSGVHYALQSADRPKRIDTKSVISIERENGPPLAIAIFPLTPATPAAHALIGVVILDPVTDLSCATEVTCRAYGLTPTEIRLVGHLAKGISLIDACKVMRIKPQTGRTYLKQIFSKFGISRQVDLMRRVLNNAVPIRFAAPPTN